MGYSKLRQKIWDAIRGINRVFGVGEYLFSVREVTDIVGANYFTVKAYITGLVNAGYLQKDTLLGGANCYRLARDTGADAPRVRGDGTNVTGGRVIEQLWRTIRVLKEFTIRGLAISAATEETPVAEETAKKYVRHLYNAGYLRRMSGANDKSGAPQFSLYRHMRTGPKPPQIRRDGTVYDPNLDREMEPAP